MNSQLNELYGAGPGVQELQAGAAALRNKLLKKQADGVPTETLEFMRTEGLEQLEAEYQTTVDQELDRYENTVEDLRKLYLEKLQRTGADELAQVAKYQRLYALKSVAELEAEAQQVIRGEKFFPDISEAETFLLELRGKTPKLFEVTKKAMDTAGWSEPWKRLVAKDHRDLAEQLKRRTPGYYYTIAISPSTGARAVLGRSIPALCPPLSPNEYQRERQTQREADREKVLSQKFQKMQK